MSNRSTLLLEHHLKELRLPTFLREYRKLAAQCAAEGGPSRLPAASRRTGTHRPPPAHGRAPHPGRHASPRSSPWIPSTSWPSPR